MAKGKTERNFCDPLFLEEEKGRGTLYLLALQLEPDSLQLSINPVTSDPDKSMTNSVPPTSLRLQPGLYKAEE